MSNNHHTIIFEDPPKRDPQPHRATLEVLIVLANNPDQWVRFDGEALPNGKAARSKCTPWNKYQVKTTAREFPDGSGWGYWLKLPSTKTEMIVRIKRLDAERRNDDGLIEVSLEDGVG